MNGPVSLSLILIDKPYLHYEAELIQCTVGMCSRPGPQLKYLEVLSCMCFNKIEMQTSGSFGLPHLPDVHVQKPSSRQMGNLKCWKTTYWRSLGSKWAWAYDYNVGLGSYIAVTPTFKTKIFLGFLWTWFPLYFSFLCMKRAWMMQVSWWSKPCKKEAAISMNILADEF